jgi:excisionase family DNA binding protein
MPKEHEDRPELSTYEVADELGISPPTVRALVARGAIPAVRYYKRLKFTRRAVDEFKERSQIRALAA